MDSYYYLSSITKFDVSKEQFMASPTTNWTWMTLNTLQHIRHCYFRP